jgi:2-C-methyl-D-erythritol 4-phosphate cytidylyltransferase/2-C-methyl-D-erythritol 2,4-cyclodiphosphate synthase
MSNLTLILLSAGESSRFNFRTKKQWLRVGGSPLWLNVLNRFQSMGIFSKIVITAHKDEVPLFKKFTTVEVIEGGSSRQQSITNGIERVETEFVIISDIARCYISEDMVSRLVESRYLADVVVPYLPVSDTVVVGNENVNRDEVKLIQTPQISKTEVLKTLLLSTKEEFSDESSLFVANGYSRYFVLGDRRANKLTYSSDVESSHCFDGGYRSRVVVGNGFDVHQFISKEGREMYLGGVKIDTHLSFKAHSDGDVLIHSLIDALLGGAGVGDIGEMFPDSDEKYRGADSLELLKDVYSLIHKIGWEIENLDITVIAQIPRLGKYKDLIRERLSETLGTSLHSVNIKATTTEKLGFIGRKEGVGVITTASLREVDWRTLFDEKR